MLQHPPTKAPVITQLDAVPAGVARQLGLDGYVGELFVVVASGVHAGRWFETGEVLACTGEAGPDDVIVLVARGVGRPRLGTAVGRSLVGDAGEPCHPDRWRSAGRVAARVHAAGNGWVRNVVEESTRRVRSVGVPSRGAAVGGRGGRPPAAQPAPRSQLSLFSAVADGARRAA